MILYNRIGEAKTEFSPSPSSVLVQELMVEDAISASWTSEVCTPIEIDDYLLLAGIKYKARAAYMPRKTSTQEYHYSVKFFAPIHDGERVMLLHLTDGAFNAEFSLDGTPREHLQKLVDNLNRTAGAGSWRIGTVIDAPRKTIDYHAMTCMQAASTIAETFATEWWVDGNVLNLCPCERGERVSLGYRQGLTTIEAEENSGATFFTRLIPLGATRNIDASKYGHARLLLPGGQKYVERNTRLGLIERVEQEAFADIYPKYVGRVSSVRTEKLTSPEGKPFMVYYFSDSGMAFDPNALPLQGQVKRLTFQSGDLNGREFEANYDSRKKEWEIINVYPEEGRQIPGGQLIPRVGDTYIPWNFRMPDEYIHRAEQDLLAAVNDYLARYSEDPTVYHCTTDYVHIDEQRVPLQLGGRVRLLSPEHFAGQGGGRDTRITKLVRSLSNLSVATLTCNNQAVKGWRSAVDSSLSNLRYVLDKQVQQTAIELIKTWDDTTPTDYNVLSSLRTAKEIERRALSRTAPDTAAGHITYADGLTSERPARLLQGFETLDFAGGIIGRGARVDQDGRAELESLFVRHFLEVPELRYNRIEITQGERWNSFGGGIVESVNTAALSLRLKLEAGERPTLAVNDLCKGIYNTGGGFATCFFRVESVTPEGEVVYSLRPGYTLHPVATMHFVAFGNPKDKSRQASAYSTTSYTRYLRGVDDWEIRAENIAMQLGDLSNLSVYGLQLEGYSAYLNNVYFTGLIAQIDNAIANKQTALKRELDASIADAKAVRMPDINPDTGNWMIWDESTKTLVDSGIKAKGEDGLQGPRGLQGIQGAKGDQGVPGAKGADGKTSYTHIAYADTATGGGFSQSPAGKAYIGMYVDFTETDSTAPNAYKWSLIKGADGAQGTPGKAGADGRTPYLHIAYATSADGTQGFSVSESTGKSYIGQYTDYTQADSSNPSTYKWSLIKGEDGRDGIDWGAAKMLYRDPLFKQGRNETYPYGSLDTNLLLLERVTTGEGNPYPSTHMLRITSKGQCTPGWGGFYFATPTRANQVLITRIVAKIPVGRSIAFGTNALAPGHTHRWLTPTAGTGGWQEYIYYVQQGIGGSYHKTNYFYLTGGGAPTPAAPLLWYVAFASVYDATDMEADYMAEITAKAGELKTYVDGAFADGMIDAAEARAIAKYTNIVETERASLEATYAKAYANPLLVGAPKTTLLNAKVSWEGKVTALLASIHTAVADGKTTATEKADVDSKYGAYKTDTAALGAALQEASKAIQEATRKAAVAEAAPRVEVRIDATALDANKYYPVTIGRLLQHTSQTIQLWRDLNTTLYNVPTWGAHARGCTINLTWVSNGSDWGTRPVDRRIITYHTLHMRDTLPPVGNVGQITEASIEYCYVRGGSHYSVAIEGTADAAITLHPGGYAWSMGVYNRSLPVLDAVTAPKVTMATIDDLQPTHLLPMPHDPTVTYVGGSTYAAVVYDTNNQWYKAVKDVPANTPLSNRTYWQPISSMGAVGMQEAYVRSLWANQAFVDKLHAQTITAQVIKAGVNPSAPGGYNALIDERGYGHLRGGALRFDENGLFLGAFDVTRDEVAIKDEQGNQRVLFSGHSVPPLAQLLAASTFQQTIPARATVRNRVTGFASRGYAVGQMPGDHPYMFPSDSAPWYRWRGTGIVELDVCTITRPDSQVSFRVNLEAGVTGADLYGCTITVELINDRGDSRLLSNLTYENERPLPYNIGAYGLPAGKYKLRATYDMAVRSPMGGADSFEAYASAAIPSGGTLKSNPQNYRHIAYHKDGWYIAYPDLLVHMSADEGLHMSGNVNLPGVLCGARVNSNRVATYHWGKFALAVGKTEVWVDRDSSGMYKVYHSIGHDRYIPTVTPQKGGALMVEMLDVYSNYFTFKLYNRSGVVASSAFNFQCIGSNR